MIIRKDSWLFNASDSLLLLLAASTRPWLCYKILSRNVISLIQWLLEKRKENKNVFICMRIFFGYQFVQLMHKWSHLYPGRCITVLMTKRSSYDLKNDHKIHTTRQRGLQGCKREYIFPINFFLSFRSVENEVAKCVGNCSYDIWTVRRFTYVETTYVSHMCCSNRRMAFRVYGLNDVNGIWGRLLSSGTKFYCCFNLVSSSRFPHSIS